MRLRICGAFLFPGDSSITVSDFGHYGFGLHAANGVLGTDVGTARARSV